MPFQRYLFASNAGVLLNNLPPVRCLPANTTGKDFVVGDLHGCFDLLERLLVQACFDTACDRLFSVGDMIDRGPDSFSCLQLLAEPWFHAVQGNHEIMMLNFFLPYMVNGQLESLDENNETDFLANGGTWVEAYYQADRQCMTEEFNRSLVRLLDMPLIWVVGEGKSRFHVIHGELVRPDYRTSGQIVWLDSDIDRWVKGEEIHPNTQDRLYWGRKLMLSKAAARNNTHTQRGLSTTFCGHTYAKNPRQVFSHLCVDTGAFVSMENDSTESGEYGLTLFDVRDARWIRASYGRPGVTKGDMLS